MLHLHMRVFWEIQNSHTSNNVHYLRAFREQANELIKSLTNVFERWGREAVSDGGREVGKGGISHCSAKNEKRDLGKH